MTISSPVCVVVSRGKLLRSRVVAVLAVSGTVSAVVFARVSHPPTLIDLFVGIVGIVVLVWPVHEGLHWLCFLFVGSPARQITFGPLWQSVHVHGVRLSRPRYVLVLMAPLIVLIGIALGLLLSGTGVLLAVMLLAGTPPVFVNDFERAIGVLRSPAGLTWEDVPGEALGW